MTKLLTRLRNPWVTVCGDDDSRDTLLTDAADEIERLTALVTQWEGNCTGRHGSQSPCGLTAEHTVPADRPTVEPSVAPTREEALSRIEEACRSIEILCDHFGMDPAEFLADSRAEKSSSEGT
jgi:hypothetical protein